VPPYLKLGAANTGATVFREIRINRKLGV